MISLKKIRAGDKPTLARAISLIENTCAGTDRLLAGLSPVIGKAHRIGVTGPPGVGKSTLVNELTRVFRQQHQTVGIIAVDPSSIFSGGAILGDRIRMQKIGLDAGVFIRSMATRGCAGGLSRATSEAADLLDAAGKSFVIIETVGVGQSEVEIFKNVDTTILVLSPESGDAIQAMKAGIMEIADIIVINKADRPGADSLLDALRNTISLNAPRGTHNARHAMQDNQAGTIPIFKTEALNSVGIKEVADYLAQRWTGLKASGELDHKRRTILQARIKSLVLNRLEEKIWSDKKVEKLINQSLDKILDGRHSPYHAVERILKTILRG